jgi:GT2 family glycosyltransferase
MYGEEQDWCWRAKAAGWEVWFDPEATVTHLGGASAARVPYEMLAHRFASSFKLLGKHEGAGAARLARALVAAAAVQNAALAAVRRLSRRDDADTFRHERKGAATVLKAALSGRPPRRPDAM